jgi:hypothetical protein
VVWVYAYMGVCVSLCACRVGLRVSVRPHGPPCHCATPPAPQLRNPIHAMYGAVTQLAGGALDAAGAALELGTLSNGIDLMIGVTNDLLDAEALRAGRLRMRPAPTDLRECLERCIPASGAVAVRLEVESDVPERVELDPLRLRQVCAFRQRGVQTTVTSCCMHVVFACVSARACMFVFVCLYVFVRVSACVCAVGGAVVRTRVWLFYVPTARVVHGRPGFRID